MDTPEKDVAATSTAPKTTAAATPPTAATRKPRKPRKRKPPRPMSPSTAKAIELVAKRAGDDAERRQRVDLARQKAFGETTDDVFDALDDNGRLDLFARFYLAASGPNRRKILNHPACPSEEELLAYIDAKLAHLLDE